MDATARLLAPRRVSLTPAAPAANRLQHGTLRDKHHPGYQKDNRDDIRPQRPDRRAQKLQDHPPHDPAAGLRRLLFVILRNRYGFIKVLCGQKSRDPA